MNEKETVKQMTVEEKAELCSGKDFWHTKAIPRLGVNSVMLTDGPHGLRKQAKTADHLGINASVRATCFPPACATGNSFNVALLEKMGEAIGEECVQEEVAVVLGPGLNIKRSPLCGRNFEYFSEDPLVSGALAAGFVRGVQRKNVGACLKHFAANSQETARMINDSVVDERALNEIYLRGFEYAVKESHPRVIMGSYNKLNSEYVCESKTLLTNILRKKWGFDGVTVTDWGAMNDKVKALGAGLDLEMPYDGGDNDRLLARAVKDGKISDETLSSAAERIVKLVASGKTTPKLYDEEAHHNLAREVAENCAVLLKNEGGILPLAKTDRVCILGRFAKELRFQGGGSSKINPTKVDNVCDALDADGIAYTYADGYDFGNAVSETLQNEAVAAAEQCGTVVIFAGLPDAYESEGFDRTHIDLPASHNALISAIAAKHKNTVVVLIHGSVVRMPWRSEVRAVLSLSLPGQAGGSAAVNLLYGNTVPSGRLSETYIDDIAKNPSFRNFGHTDTTYYKESVFVGYRFYNTAKTAVTFPFGYGLSYCNFEYSDLKLSKDTIGKNDGLSVGVRVKNLGAYDAYETVQLYVKSPSSGNARPERELRAFTKLFVKVGETAEVQLRLVPRDFSYYNVRTHNFELENGAHTVIIGKNAIESILEKKVFVKADNAEKMPEVYQDYLPAQTAPLDISDEKFCLLYGKELPVYVAPRKKTYTKNASLGEIKNTAFGKKLFDQTLDGMKTQIGNTFGDDLSNLEGMLNDMPLRALAMFSGGAITAGMLQGFIDILNGKRLRGLLNIIKWAPKVGK